MNKIALTILLLLLPLISKAIEAEIDGLKYSLTIDKDNKPVAEVVWKWISAGLYGYNQGDYHGAINIPEKVNYEGVDFLVTKIGEDAFSNSPYLTSVTIPNSVTSIGHNAFDSCTSLTSVAIPNSVTSIGSQAFAHCTNLASVTLSNSMEILDDIFYGCSSLKSVIIPNSVTKILFDAFRDCTSLTSVTIPNSVTSLDGAVFIRCSSLTSVTIPNSVTSIGRSAFNGCSSLKSVKLSNRLKTIRESIFKGCTSLTSVTIPNSATVIEECAFQNCSSLTTVIIGTSMNTIEGSAFENCSKLKDVYSFSEQVWGERGNIVYSNIFRGASISSATLHVPAESLLFYKFNYPWSDFGNIVALTITDPNQIEIEDNEQDNSDEDGEIADAIDLGLSVKWAKWNIGANSPEESGLYFNWASVQPRTQTPTENNPDGAYMTDWDEWSKYTTMSNFSYKGIPDYKTVLEAEDDVAYVMWGTGWKIPSKEEFKELIDKCNWYWTKKNGKNGYLVTGSNGNSIFIPESGNSMWNHSIVFNGGTGLWSRNVYTSLGDNFIYALYFDSKSRYIRDIGRCDILAVRPVYVGKGEGTIINTVISKEFEKNRYYNLQGQRVLLPSKGIFIKNGKKVFIK